MTHGAPYTSPCNKPKIIPSIDHFLGPSLIPIKHQTYFPSDHPKIIPESDWLQITLYT